jgi:phosphoribosylformylglycinamidine synthase
MSTVPRAGVIVFYGANCDHDTHYVLEHVVGFETEYIWHEDTDLDRFDLVVLPGGFSYGDYLRVGAIARFADVMKALPEYIESRNGYVVGICNGFQILIEAGLLPGALTRNVGLKFICRNLRLRVENADTAFTSRFDRGEVVESPIAHSDGRFYARDEVLKGLWDRGQVFLTYHGENPNGSVRSVAGVMNESGTVFGLMPHPERNSEPVLGTGDGRRFFESIMDALRQDGDHGGHP